MKDHLESWAAIGHWAITISYTDKRKVCGRHEYLCILSGQHLADIKFGNARFRVAEIVTRRSYQVFGNVG